MIKGMLVYRIGVISMVILVTGCGRSPNLSKDPGRAQDSPAVKRESFARSDGPEPEQALEDYTFNGFTEGTNRRWEVKGRSAEIFNEFIKMFQVRAQAFAEDGSLSVTATSKEGKMYMANSNVRMEKEVILTTPDGAELKTDYLDWDAQRETAVTEAYVVVKKDNMVLEGDGAEGKTDMQKVEIKKNAKVTVYDQSIIPNLFEEQEEDNDKEKEPLQEQGRDDGKGQSQEPGQQQSQAKNKEEKQPTIITSDSAEIYLEKNLAQFFGNVLLDDEGGRVHCDRMDMYIDSKTKTVKNAVAMGNVKIEEKTKVSYCEKASYDLESKKITLLPDSELPQGSKSQVKIIIYPGEGGKIAPFGD